MQELSLKNIKCGNMNTILKIRVGAILVALALIFAVSCKKATSTTTNLSTDDNNSAMDLASLDEASSDAENVADVAIAGGTDLRTTPSDLGSCATITLDTTSVPHVLTIDFGTTDCLGADLNYRRGKIIVTYNKGHRDSGSSHTISYDNYYFNDNRLGGSKTVTNMGRNSSGKYYYDISVDDSLYLDSTTVISWTGNRVRTWVEGYYTASRLDDQYDIYGTTTITRPSGKWVKFDVSASDPLHTAIKCRWIESGEVTATRSGGGSYTIDYGSGTCDRLATLTVGGKTYNITLR